MRASVSRVVLDTDVLVSALLFRGRTNALVSLWARGKIRPLVSKEVLVEYLRTLSYPKFELAKTEVLSLLEEYFLPYADPVKVDTKFRVISHDPDDDKFLDLAVCGRADAVISGDKHLLELGEFRGIPIVRAGVFLEKF